MHNRKIFPALVFFLRRTYFKGAPSGVKIFVLKYTRLVFVEAENV